MSYKSGVFCFSEKPVDALKFDTMVSSFAETTAQAICSSLLAAPIDETEIQSKIVQTRMYLAATLARCEEFVTFHYPDGGDFEPQIAASIHDVGMMCSPFKRTTTFFFTFVDEKKNLATHITVVYDQEIRPTNP